MFDWLRDRRRRRILERPFPAEWEPFLARLAAWRLLDDPERAQLRALVQVFVAEKHWEGCGGLELDDEIRVTIAGLACVLVLGLEHVLYRNVESILVYPSAVLAPGGLETALPGFAVERAAVPIAGQAMLGGPVLLVWDAVRRDAVHPRKGHNVVFHEFAHKLDMLDGWIDGAPPLGGGERHARWTEVCTRELERLGRAAELGVPSFLDAYGATNPGEFFAVITEVFFARPSELRERHAELYDVLRDFYRQDPAEREARAG